MTHEITHMLFHAVLRKLITLVVKQWAKLVNFLDFYGYLPLM